MNILVLRQVNVLYSESPFQRPCRNAGTTRRNDKDKAHLVPSRVIRYWLSVLRLALNRGSNSDTMRRSRSAQGG